MFKNPNIPSNFGFGIWFNKKEKRESRSYASI